MAEQTLPILALQNISKTFGGHHALKNVDLTINPGEVHGLLGENGSGKSTLIKILAGYHSPNPNGQLFIRGKGVKLPLDPGEYRKYGISFVHQDLGLIPSLTVVENLNIGRLASGNRWFIAWEKECSKARKVFLRFGLNIDPMEKVSDLSPVEQAMLAIVRAIEEIDRSSESHASGGILVLDEPTVFLPKTDIDQLFALVREITKTGTSVLFVSHDLDEVIEITDRITVLRDGELCGTLVTSKAKKQQIIEMIIGKELKTAEKNVLNNSRYDAQISVKELTGNIVQDVNITMQVGEVLGITGLKGSGFEEIPYLLFGAERAFGFLEIGGKNYDLGQFSPGDAIKSGMVLIPSDRQGAGVIGELSVLDNCSMLVLGNYTNKFRKLNLSKMLVDTKTNLNNYDVRPNDPQNILNNLSGGNQQKVLLAKAFQTNPKLVLLDEPTQGVDIGARHQIFEIIEKYVSDGGSIICCSSDYEQLEAICNRVLVLGRGKVVSELSGDDVTKDRVIRKCYESIESDNIVI